jgi:putative ABC transport system permease protein
MRLYPASFRLEYGGELERLFALRRREASSAAWFWLEQLADVVWNAARVHLDLLRQDVRYSLRTLARSPAFTFTAVLVTALGVGANTSAFSVTDRVLIRPLPFPDEDRLVTLWENVAGYPRLELSAPNYLDWKRLATSFEGAGAFVPSAVNLVGLGEPLRLEGVAVTPELLSLLGAEPLLGRLISADDVKEGAPQVLVLSYGLWQAEFGGAHDIVGKSVRLGDLPATVIGVLPKTFRYPNANTRYWMAAGFNIVEGEENRDNNWLNVVARLKPGVSLEKARAEMNLVAEQLERAYPKENEKTRATVAPLGENVSRQSRQLLIALFAASACVLLIACTNLASLLLARAVQRRRELSVRAAMGAGRERLVRQLLTESLLLALAGGALGVLLALAAGPVLARLVPPSLPLSDIGAVDPRVLGFAAIVTLSTGVAFGVVPAWRSCGGADVSGLREGGRGGVGGGRERLRSALVVAEVTAALVLVVSSGLLIRALARVRAVDPGFRTEGVLTLRTALQAPRYASVARRQQLYERVLSELRGLPGVQQAAYISYLPMVMRGGIWAVEVGGVPADRREGQTASMRFTTPGFFDALRVPLLRGRSFDERDTQTSPFVAVVSQSLARRHWPDRDPIGERFTIAFSERTIVGVVGDVKVRGLERLSEPQVYLPHGQVKDGWMMGYAPKDLVIRSTVEPQALLAAVRRIVKQADPELPISDVRTLQDILDSDTSPRQVQIRVLSAFAGLSLLLAGLGIYGLLSYAVSQRIPEIGVRLALGARPSSILKMVLGDGVRLLAIGALLGLGLAYAAGRTLEALLAGVPASDPLTFAAALGLALVTTLVGCLVPALRAVRVDPTVALRSEA